MDSLTHKHSPKPNAQPGQEPGWGERFRSSKALLPTVAVLGVTSLALAAALLSNRIGAQDGVPRATVEAISTPMLPFGQKAPAKVAPTVQHRQTVAVACNNCGVVESVTPVQRQGAVNGIGNSGIGVGAVAGGVIGGLLGNQVGGGSGKTAATVLGAAGGAYAGHSIEKNSKTYTAYQIRVRMANGTYRTLEQGTAVAAGSRVVVEGNALRLAAVSTSGANAAQRVS